MMSTLKAQSHHIHQIVRSLPISHHYLLRRVVYLTTATELLPELAKYYDIEVIVAQQEVSNPWIRKYLPIQSIEYFTKMQIATTVCSITSATRLFISICSICWIVFLAWLFSTTSFLEISMSIWRTRSQESGAVRLYSSHGYNAVWERFHTSDIKEVIFKYPCKLGIVKGALGIIVHSRQPQRTGRGNGMVLERIGLLFRIFAFCLMDPVDCGCA